MGDPVSFGRVKNSRSVRDASPECHVEATARKGASDQSATWGGTIAQLVAGKSTTSHSKTPIPEMKLVYHRASADWRKYPVPTPDMATKECVLPFSRGVHPNFTYCPLPHLTHPCGAYVKATNAWKEAVRNANDTRAIIRVAHANFMNGATPKLTFLKHAGAWGLAPGGEKRAWPEGCQAAA